MTALTTTNIEQLISHYKFIIERGDAMVAAYYQLKKKSPDSTSRELKIRAVAQVYGYKKCASTSEGWRLGNEWCPGSRLLEDYPKKGRLKQLKLLLQDLLLKQFPLS